MIRFTERVGELGPVLIAEGTNVHGDPDPVRITSEEMTDADRRRQALLLIDAAASLIDGDDDCARQFEQLHEVLESMPKEPR